MDIVSNAGREVGASVEENLLRRIAVIGNGYPNFSHLIGKALMTEAIRADGDHVEPGLYKAAINSAVRESIQELRLSYETAVQRRDGVYKHVLSAMANADVVGQRINDIEEYYSALARQNGWPAHPRPSIGDTLNRLKQQEYGLILTNTPTRWGGHEKRYRYYRFSHSLMRGHVRLRAEDEAGLLLGQRLTL